MKNKSTPYLKEIFKILEEGKEPVKEIVIMKGAATGMTTATIIPGVIGIIDEKTNEFKLINIC